MVTTGMLLGRINPYNNKKKILVENQSTNDIIQSILDKKDIKINANYRIYRSYMYADDLVKWLLKILDNSNTQCPIYNVGSNNKISIHQVANTLSKKYNLRIDSVKLSSKKFDNYVPNINKAKKSGMQSLYQRITNLL